MRLRHHEALSAKCGGGVLRFSVEFFSICWKGFHGFVGGFDVFYGFLIFQVFSFFSEVFPGFCRGVSCFRRFSKGFQMFFYFCLRF